MDSVTGNQFGASRLAVTFPLLLLALVVILGVTKYFELSGKAESSVEEGVVSAIRQGVADHAERARGSGQKRVFPVVLDTARVGRATMQNEFFGNVLERSIAVDGWEKMSEHEYKAPSGERYVYDPGRGTFTMSGTKNE